MSRLKSCIWRESSWRGQFADAYCETTHCDEDVPVIQVLRTVIDCLTDVSSHSMIGLIESGSRSIKECKETISNINAKLKACVDVISLISRVDEAVKLVLTTLSVLEEEDYIIIPGGWQSVSLDQENSLFYVLQREPDEVVDSPESSAQHQLAHDSTDAMRMKFREESNNGSLLDATTQIDVGVDGNKPIVNCLCCRVTFSSFMQAREQGLGCGDFPSLLSTEVLVLSSTRPTERMRAN